MIDVSGLNKAELLAALYNRATPQGMGFLNYDPAPMTTEQASEILKGGDQFDYLKGRVMKVCLKGDSIEEGLYDRDNGAGAFAAVVDVLRTGKGADALRSAHIDSKVAKAAVVKTTLDQPNELGVAGDVATLKIGLADVADVLGPAVDKALD